MKILIAYIICFLILFFAAFKGQGKKIDYVPLQTGVLYSSSSSSKTILSSEVTEKSVYKKIGDDSPVFEVFSKEKLPGKFIVKLTKDQDVKYYLTLKPKKINKRPKKVNKKHLETQKKKEIAQTKKIVKLTTMKKTVPEEVLNINKVKRIVDNSNRTYYFHNIDKSIDKVSLIIKSITPYQNKSILTLELVNEQDTYFFISNVAVISDNLPLTIKKFHPPFLTGQKTANIYIITRSLSHEALKVKVSEFTGKARMFNLSVVIP
jgi:hypothetical protein